MVSSNKALAAMVVALPLVLVVLLPSSVFGYIPRENQTRGELWPKPQKQKPLPGALLVVPEIFEWAVTGQNCPILENALRRYTYIIFLQGSKGSARRQQQQQKGSLRRRPKDLQYMNQSHDILSTLHVNLAGKCEEWPSLNMDEAYELTIDPANASFLKSNSIWGILRGLETFSQLIHVEDPLSKDLYINGTIINDFPRFSHRGILLDTCRHFISMANIYKVLDGMAYNKMNVFHWHIVDDQSFPYESARYPTLSQKGAFHPSQTYSQSDVQKVIEYARMRGIRVMPEFDTPGHTRAWGLAYPELLTECYSADGKPNGDIGPMDPTNDYLYTFIENLFKEVVTVFPDAYLHLGGDEVDFNCWKSNPRVNQFMKDRNITTYQGLEEVYIQKVVDIVDKLGGKSAVWQEVFFNGVTLPKGTLVHAWLGDKKQLLYNITAAGLPALLSAGWYLDHLSTGGDWSKYYTSDAHDFPGDEAQKKLVLGGEACMWAEVVDNNNVLTRIFPRASAVAERLWSAVDVMDVNEARYRIEEQYCRMNKRGYPAQPPNGPGYCV